MKSRTGRRAAFRVSLRAAAIPSGIAIASARIVEVMTSARVSIERSQRLRFQIRSRPSAVTAASLVSRRVTNQTSTVMSRIRMGAGMRSRIS